MSGAKSLAAQRIKQRKLDKIRIMIFGCRREWPKTTLSGDSLACTPKSSQVVDVSSSMSDIGRIPAGGFAPCGCPMDSGPGPMDSTQSLFCEVSTQTEDNERRSTNETEPGAPAESVPGRKDVATQSSFTELQNNPRRSSKKVDYNIVSTRFLPPSYIINQEDEPQSDADSVAEKHPQKWSFRRPLIVVDGSLPRISGAKSQVSRNQAMSDPQTREQRTRGQSARDQRSRSNSRGNEKSKNQPTRNQQSKQKPTRKQSEVAFVEPQQQRQGQGQGQYRSNVESESSATSFANSNQSEAEAKKDIYTQAEEQVPRGEKPAASYPCSRIPELLNRVCKLETKLRNQEHTLRSLQCAMKASKPANCSVNQPPKKCGTPCKPKCADQSTQKCADQSTQKCDKEPSDCQTLKKEFIDIFIKPETSATSTCSQKDIKKTIGICPANNNCQDSRTMYLQCVEDSDTLIQQFNQKFAKPKNCNHNKGEKNKSPCPEKCSPCFPVLNQQCMTEPESGNMLDKCVGLVAKKSKADMSNIRKASSDPCLAENNDQKPCDSRQSLKKEVYESVLEQFVKNFAKPRMECGQNLTAAQKPEGERYLFERLCAELVSLFTKPKNLESCAVKDEDKLKRVTILESNTMQEKDEQNEKPGKVEKICKDPAVSPGGCPSCSDSGKLPVLDSLVDELMKLIDCRPFRDVVLIIMRRGCNVYHINIREMATGNVLGCLLANEAAINEAMSLGLFEDIHTFCELDKQSANDCPLDAVVPQREPGGETQLASRDKERAMAFVTRVLGLQAGEAERFFFLTNALKSVKKSSDQSLVAPESSGATENTGLIGRGAITGNLVFLGNVHNAPGTSGSQSDMSELGEASKHFLRMLSGQDTEDKDKV